MEVPGIDPGTSHVLSERSTILASPLVPIMIELPLLFNIIPVGVNRLVSKQLSLDQITDIKLGVLCS